MTNPNTLANPINKPFLDHLEKMGVPPHRVLADFVQGCSADPNARTVAVTTLVVSLWQLAGRGMTHHMPSLILLNASESATDPISGFAARLVNERGDIGPKIHWAGAFLGGDPEIAPVAMANALVEKHRLGVPTPHNLQRHMAIDERYFAAQITGFGSGRTRSYSTAWHETFELLTDRNDEIILRLEGPDDYVAFRQHVLNDPDKFLCPSGYGAGLVPVVKHTAISGTLPPEQWDRRIATKAVELGLPFVFLPHAVTESPFTGNLPALDFLTRLLPKAFHSPVVEPANLLPGDWYDRYGRGLRERLRELPGTYEYSIQRMARQLFPVCRRLASWAGQQQGAKNAEVEALCLDLYGHALRGLMIGVAGLAWHGLGFNTSGPIGQTEKVLKHLRNRGPMTKSDLVRGAHVTKAARDGLLERFVAEDLVRVDGKVVTATTYDEFVSSLYARKEFPMPENHLDKIAKRVAPVT